jgi:GAF domain-containing protein
VAQFEDGRTSIVPGGVESGAVLALTDPMVAQAWESHEFVYMPDILKDNQARQGPQSPIRSVMISPIRSRGRMLGLMNVGCIRPSAYSENDVAVFQQLVTQLGVVLEAAEAFSQSQRVAKNEALVNDISTLLQQQLDVEKMLGVTVNQLGKALGAQKARIRLSTAHAENDESQP